MSLTGIYGVVPSICLMDDDGVYLEGKKISLDNTRNSGYIRYDGMIDFEKVGNGCGGDHWVRRSLVFCGCAPKADAALLLQATVAGLAGGDSDIIEATIDKKIIAEREGIDIDELRKFNGVAMVWVRYRTVTVETLDPKCAYPIC